MEEKNATPFQCASANFVRQLFACENQHFFVPDMSFTCQNSVKFRWESTKRFSAGLFAIWQSVSLRAGLESDSMQTEPAEAFVWRCLPTWLPAKSHAGKCRCDYHLCHSSLLFMNENTHCVEKTFARRFSRKILGCWFVRLQLCHT